MVYFGRSIKQHIRIIVLCLSCTPIVAYGLTNQLKDHPSPYLALHANDPVAWQDWDERAVKRARRENKLLYLSIGYFSCHWCHVMQRESYQNNEIAAFLNTNFIPVKIDRELEPTLDARMIEFIESTRGMGGWPLNVFVTPKGDPLYGVLYLPPDQFLQILKRLGEMWQQDAVGLTDLAQREAAKSSGPGQPTLDTAQIDRYTAKLIDEALQRADVIYGGFGSQSKFPSVPQLEFLLEEIVRAPNPRLKEFLQLTLDHMVDYGLQDQLGGGFFRYTVDPEWRTPHFEKMLYDNAQLSRLYLRAAKVLGRKDYERVTRRTLDFMIDKMRTPSGAFIASFSAVDNEGVEGGYYLWDPEELRERLEPREREAYMQVWGMQDAPPFEDGYLPFKGLSVDEIAKQMKLTPAAVNRLLSNAARKLRSARARRVLPPDTKLLAGWNGLALRAFAEAAQLTRDTRYRSAAEGIRDYLMQTLWDGKQLQRAVSGKRDRPVGKPSVEDYAYVAQGLLAWAELTGDTEDYAQAKQVVMQAWKRFYSVKGWRMGESSFIGAEAAKDVLFDGPMPSPSGVIAQVSLRLAAKTGDKALRDRALAALNSGHREIAENAFWYATQIGAMLAAR